MSGASHLSIGGNPYPQTPKNGDFLREAAPTSLVALTLGALTVQSMFMVRPPNWLPVITAFIVLQQLGP